MIQPLIDYRQSLKDITEEQEQRDKIICSEEYQKLSDHIEQLKQQQDTMLASIPDSREENEMDKQDLIKYMRDNNLFEIEEFKAKTRAKNEVNTQKVMNALEGDLDNFFILAKINQKDWKTFCTDNPVYKKHQNKCIDQIEARIVDIEIIS